MENHAQTTIVTINDYKIKGFTSANNVRNYLGIPYASIPSRFRQAQLIDSSKLNSVHDATEYGPCCPQAVDVGRAWRGHLYEGIKHSISLSTSEFECLNLNIYAPKDNHTGRLPVFVWIHGGGFVAGDGGPEYDGNFLVQYSMERGKPIIYVAFNYRLGLFGFLSSIQLKEEAKAAGEKQYSNMGLLDQRLALHWIRTNIHHFGGDGNNITLAGESAGAWSVMAHIRSNVPVCRRAVIMSCPSMAPTDPLAAQQLFDDVVKKAGLDAKASDSEKLTRLRKLSSEELVSLTPQGLLIPAWDGEWFSHQAWKDPIERVGPFPSWIEGILSGWVKDEYALFGIPNGWKDFTSVDIEKIIRHIIPDSDIANEVTKFYGIDEAISQSAALDALIKFASDAFFAVVPSYIAASASSSVSIYRFDQIDMVRESPFCGYSYHALDNVFTCRLPAIAGEYAPAEWRTTANVLSQSLNDFIYGLHPWETYNSSRRIQIVDGSKSRLAEWVGPNLTLDMDSTPEKAKMILNAATCLLSLNRNALSEY